MSQEQVYFRFWNTEYPEEGCNVATSYESLFENLKAWFIESDELGVMVEKITKEEFNQMKDE